MRSSQTITVTSGAESERILKQMGSTFMIGMAVLGLASLTTWFVVSKGIK